MFIGKDLKDDPEYQARLKAGAIPAPKAAAERPPLKPAAKASAFLFLVGVALVVLFGFFPALRTLPGAKSALADADRDRDRDDVGRGGHAARHRRSTSNEVPKTSTLRAGVVAVIGIFGLAWLGDSFIAANKDVIVPAIGAQADAHPWTFAFGLFFASVLLYSQAATTRALMPLGIALGIPPQFLIAMFPSVNGYFFIPTYGSLIAAINFDLSGTTKIGKYVLNHSFMIPGVVATAVAVITGLAPCPDHVLIVLPEQSRDAAAEPNGWMGRPFDRQVFDYGSASALATSSTMSRVSMSDSYVCALTASLIIVVQQGQAVAMTRCCCGRAPSKRTRLIRRPIFSSIHIRAPPTPEHMALLRRSGNSSGASRVSSARIARGGWSQRTSGASFTTIASLRQASAQNAASAAASNSVIATGFTAPSVVRVR